MAVLTVIQARTASTRMPDKVLLKLGKHAILEHVVNRLRMCEQDLGTVIVATGSHRRDNRIDELCREIKVPCFRGPEHDVLNRFMLAAMHYNPDLIVRVTADCPLLDPMLVDRIVSEHAGDITRVEGAAKGVGEEELITVEALTRLWTDATEPHDREHVSTYAEVHCSYAITYLDADDWLFDHHQHRLVLDTLADWQQLEHLYALTDGDLFRLPTRTVIEALEAEPVPL